MWLREIISLWAFSDYISHVEWGGEGEGSKKPPSIALALASPGVGNLWSLCLPLKPSANQTPSLLRSESSERRERERENNAVL